MGIAIETTNLDLAQLKRELRYVIEINGRNLYNPETMTAGWALLTADVRANSLSQGVNRS